MVITEGFQSIATPRAAEASAAGSPWPVPHLPLLAFAPTDVENKTGSRILLLTSSTFLSLTPSVFLSHFHPAKYKFYPNLANAGSMTEFFLAQDQAA